MALAATSATALALAGCSNSASTGTDEKTVTFFSTTDYQEAYEQLIDKFEEENPGVTVNATFVGGNDQESTQNTQLSAGNGADVIAVQPGTSNLISVGSLVENGHLADLSDSAWAADIPDSLRPVTDVDDKTYMFPGILQPLGAFYNTEATEAAGLELPQTWKEVLAFCSDAAAQDKVAYSLGLQDQWVTQLVPYALASTLVYGPNPDWNAELNAGEVTFPDSAWLQVENQYLEMRDAGCFSADPNGISFDNTLPPVADGEALGIVQVGGIFGNLQGQNEDVTYRLEPLPATDDAAATLFAGSPGIGLGLNAAAENPELARKFIDFVAAPENINAFATTLGGAVPAIGNDSFEAPAILETFNTFVSDGRVVSFPDTGWSNPEIQNAHLVGIQNMFLGTETPQQVLEAMQAAVER